MPDPLDQLTQIRLHHPERIAEVLRARRRRPLLDESDRIFLVAADHPARGVVKAGTDPHAMADRGELLRRLLLALERPGVDGLLATADVVEDLALLGALEGKVVFGSMNRGGLAGSVFELDDRFTAYTAEAIERSRLDGGKMMVRVADQDRATLETLVGCRRALDQLAARKLPAMVEVFAEPMEARALMRAIAVVSGLGESSAYTWLKLPVLAGMDDVLRATSLPVVLLGGDPGRDAETVHRRWEEALAIPRVCGLVAGRTLLYPEHGDVSRAVDEAAAIVHPGAAVPR